MGGFTTGKKEIIDMLRQRSRPYLFSNSVAPAIVGASLEMFKMLKESDALHTKLMNNVSYFREKMLAAGFDIKPTQSAICAVMLYDAKLSQDFAAKMQEEGIDFYMMPTADFHNSEYVNDYFKVREYFCNFTGSNGTLVVWKDGRGIVD